MRRRALIFILAALLPSSLLASGAPAQEAPSFSPCPENPGFACTTITVPLERGGPAPGTISLRVERELAGTTPSREAVVALAGGPGQAALPLASFIAKAIAPALAGRDLIVFDQRGTGHSDPLSCAALSRALASTLEAFGKLTEQCALQIGAARAAFTSEESVADIEAIRAALGYEKLVLYGTSYGTKVALRYAEAEPQRVQALVLDSVVPADGPEPFSVQTFKAIRPMLAELCSAHACTRITPNPYVELAQLTARLRKHRLSGSVYDGAGHRHAATLGEAELLGILQAGDLNPALRALLPAAVHSALHNDPDPLLRLSLLSEGLIPNVPEPPKLPPAEQQESEEDNALFLATSCEEKPFPWTRVASPAARRAEALVGLRALPASDFAPFDASTALQSSLIPICSYWPDASPPPPAASALPDVPTLIFSGAQDLRTPTANARAVAALIPGAQLLVVPYTGHSVLGTDFSGCAAAAVKAFFAGEPVRACSPSADPFSPTPVTPTRLAYLQPAPGLAGKPGRTLTAVLDTILDLSRQVIGATLQAERELPSGASFGGLHGGYARLSTTSVRLHDLTFVAGVEISGTLPVQAGKLQAATIGIGGPAASPGSVRIGSGARVSGTLGGRHFDLSTAKVKLSRAGAADPGWTQAPTRFPLPGLARVR